MAKEDNVKAEISKEVAMPIEDLLELLIDEILSRLPEKSLLRFKCVSKLWCALTTDPAFVKMHLRQSLASNTNLSIIFTGEASLSSVLEGAVYVKGGGQGQKGTTRLKSDAVIGMRRGVKGRRGLLLRSVVLFAPLSTATAKASQLQEAEDSRSALLQKYLKKSEVNKAKNAKERLDDYYKRNYKDYFDFFEGSVRGKTNEELSEAEKGILNWLQTNK